MDHETLLLLRATRETGLLDALLSEADDAAAAAEAAAVDGRAAAVAVEVLVAEGFLAQVGDAVEPTNRLLGFLAAADLCSVGELPEAVDAVDARAALPETTVRAAVTAAARTTPDAASVLDVGGAPGRFAVEFAARGYDVTLADDPDAVEASTPLLAGEPVATVGIEADDPLPGGFDLVFAADATVGRRPSENREHLSTLADAADDGTVVLVDRLWERSADAAARTVEAFARSGGRVYREETVAGWFDAAGLEGPAVEAVPGTERAALVGRRG